MCLAVSPSLKSCGISGRARLFEVVQKLKEVNALRRLHAPGRQFTGKSWDDDALKANPALEVDFITAPPRMALYMRRSTEIYQIYLHYVAPEDIFAYSVDEVFMDVTDYLKTYGLSAHDLTRKIIRDVLNQTGITATAGIGTNLYLAKAAMDIWAKHVEPDRDGVRIAELDEMSYRRRLWTHRPLTDFWRVGPGYAKKLEKHGLYTMGDIARCSLGGPTDFYNEELLYKLFGVNAELLIDHAWGWEPTRLSDVKAYKPERSSVGSGQVLQSPYPFDKAKLVTREMADALALDLVDKGFAADQIVLTIGYDIENLTDPERRKNYRGPVTIDRYGRRIPKHAHGTANLGGPTSSTRKIVDAAMELFDRIVSPELLVRRITITANHVGDEKAAAQAPEYEQLDLFASAAEVQKRQEEAAAL
ncbi:MAG: DNA methylase, partial [Oscillibacter sp.]|nr:DNA methylase [Oscillibacter sp.]